MLETSQSRSQYGKETGASSSEVTTIICPICDAAYVPAHVHSSFLLSSGEALESAFMSMCHFCFRCRRPACPQCWDGVHGVCGDCVRQAHLSFRTEAAPLDGLRFSPLHEQEKAREEVASALLVCARPGRFQPTTMQAEDVAIVAINTAEKNPSHQPEAGVMAQMWLPGPTTQEPQPVTGPAVVPATVETGRGDVEAGGEEMVQRSHRSSHVFRVLERVLTVLALLALLAIIVLIVLAEFSPAANTLIVQLLHIDIRAEIAYLVHLVQQLH